MLALLVIVLGMVACTNDTGNVSPVTANSNAIKYDGSRKDVNSTTTVYRVKDEILNQFQFYCQLLATNMNGVETQACAPDSYMMGANAIARFKGNYGYGATGTKLANIATKMKTTFSGGTGFGDIKSYLVSNDTDFISSSTSDTQPNRSILKTFIENALTNDQFVMVAVNAYVMKPSRRNQANLYNNNSTNSDLQPTNTGSSYYITSEKGHYQTGGNSAVGGHWILVIKITIDNASGSGVVEYIDPLADAHSPSNRKFCSYTRLLDSNQINGKNQSGYDAIAFGAKN